MKTKLLVTIVELLSPANKSHAEGRRRYETKRNQILGSLTNLVEIDLTRAGEPMMVVGPPIWSDYRILVSRSQSRPKAKLHAFGVRSPIPSFSLPPFPDDDEPLVDLNAIFHNLYDRAYFDLRLEFAGPPVPPLWEPDATWARERIAAHS